MEVVTKVLRKTTQTSVNARLMFLVILNAIDGVLTYISIHYGYAIELNPVADNFVGDFALMVLYKILLPTIAILATMIAINRRGIKKPVFVNALVNLGVGVYVFIAINHFYILAQLAHYVLVA